MNDFTAWLENQLTEPPRALRGRELRALSAIATTIAVGLLLVVCAGIPLLLLTAHRNTAAPSTASASPRVDPLLIKEVRLLRQPLTRASRMTDNQRASCS